MGGKQNKGPCCVFKDTYLITFYKVTDGCPVKEIWKSLSALSWGYFYTHYKVRIQGDIWELLSPPPPVLSSSQLYCKGIACAQYLQYLWHLSARWCSIVCLPTLPTDRQGPVTILSCCAIYIPPAWVALLLIRWFVRISNNQDCNYSITIMFAIIQSLMGASHLSLHFLTQPRTASRLNNDHAGGKHKEWSFTVGRGLPVLPPPPFNKSGGRLPLEVVCPQVCRKISLVSM